MPVMLVWGYWKAEGLWVTVPRRPLYHAGIFSVPYETTLLSGQKVTIIEREMELDFDTESQAPWKATDKKGDSSE